MCKSRFVKGCFEHFLIGLSVIIVNTSSVQVSYVLHSAALCDSSYQGKLITVVNVTIPYSSMPSSDMTTWYLRDRMLPILKRIAANDDPPSTCKQMHAIIASKDDLVTFVSAVIFCSPIETLAGQGIRP